MTQEINAINIYETLLPMLEGVATKSHNIDERTYLPEISNGELKWVDKSITEKEVHKSPNTSESFSDLESFITYINHHKIDDQTLIKANKEGFCKAYIDHNPHQSPNKAGRIQHYAIYKPIYSPIFEDWNAAEGELHTQEDFLLFLEQYAQDLLSPTPAEMLTAVQDFEVVARIASSKNLANGNRQFTYVTEKGDKSALEFPSKLLIKTPIYMGGESIEITAHLRHRANGDSGLKLGFVWHRIQQAKNDAVISNIQIIKEKTGLDVYFGDI